MPSIEAVVEWLDGKEALQPGESPWRTYEEEDELREVDWERLFPRRSQREGPEPWAFEDGWEPGFPRGFTDEVLEAAQGEEPCMVFGEEEGQRQPGGRWDICAWYQPIHYFAYDWGIFIREDCVLSQAKMIAAFLRLHGKPVCHPQALTKALVRASLFTYFLHECYHHKVECFGIRLHVVELKSAYLPYHTQVYRASVGTDDLLEEALANAYAYLRLSDRPYTRCFSRPVLDATRRFLRWRFPIDPPGYRQGANYLRGPSFAQGENLLHGQVHEATLKPSQPSTDWEMAPRMMQSFFSIASNIWSVVRPGQRPILPFNTSLPVKTCSTDEMVRICRRHGFEVITGGKGSHVKLKKQGARPIILPGNRSNVSPGVVRTILKNLGGYRIGDLPRMLKKG